MTDGKANPYAVVFSLFGGYIVPRGPDIWIGSLIQALATLGFGERNVRTIISRMKQTGYLESRQVGRRSFYRLTDRGQREVHGGSELAFGSPDARWDGQWTVVAYSIPEEQRDLRDALRDSLKAIGFGALVPGVWISPHPLPAEKEKKWQKIGVWRYLEIFRAEHVGPSEINDLVAHAWPQLPTLADRYRAYTTKYARVLDQFEKEIFDDAACFALQMQSLFEFMTIVIEDPALPAAILPGDWPRPTAQSLYLELRRMLTEPAERFFDAIYETSEVLDE